MTETPEQVQLRQHLAEMRRAASGVGKDFEITFKNLDRSIARLSSRSAKELKYDLADIQDDFARLAHAIDAEARQLPRNMKDGAVSVATAIGSGAARVGGATRDAFAYADQRVSEGTKNALARAAGVTRKPMREWSAPSESATDQ